MKALLLTVVLTLFATLSLRAEDDAQAETILKKLIATQIAKDYEGFVADGTTELKAALGKTQFEAASDLLVPKFQQEYVLTLLGELNQRGFEVYLFRLRFKNGGDDLLGTLSLKDGKVAGIYFK